VVDGMLGIIRVLTTVNQEVLQEHGRIMKEGFQVESVTRCIEGQENGIHNDLTEAIAIPKIIALAKKMSEEHDIDAITISCAADPALDEVRLVASLPILGAGVCGAYAASKVGQRVAIVGITATPPERMVKELGDRFHSASYSPKIRKSTDLFSADAKKELLSIVNKEIESGADVILFACTGFSTIGLKDYLLKYINVPVIDLVEAQAIAYQLINGGGKG